MQTFKITYPVTHRKVGTEKEVKEFLADKIRSRDFNLWDWHSIDIKRSDNEWTASILCHISRTYRQDNALGALQSFIYTYDLPNDIDPSKIHIQSTYEKDDDYEPEAQVPKLEEMPASEPEAIHYINRVAKVEVDE